MTTSHRSALAPLGVVPTSGTPEPAPPSAFSVLNELLGDSASIGTFEIIAHASDWRALSCHALRRAEMLGRPAIAVGESNPTDPWLELMRRAQVKQDSDAALIAERLVQHAAGSIVVIHDHTPSAWGKAIAYELEQLASKQTNGLLVLMLRAASTTPTSMLRSEATKPEHPSQGRVIEFDALTADDRRTWWLTVTATDPAWAKHSRDGIGALERWWHSMRRQPVDAAGVLPILNADARQLYQYLSHAGQALHHNQIKVLGLEPGALTELVENDLAEAFQNDQWIVPRGSNPIQPLTPPQALQLAAALQTGDDTDPWSMMRAAELLSIGSADYASAQGIALEALTLCQNRIGRDDLWLRWITTLDRLAAETKSDETRAADHLRCLIESAETGLALGDGDRAHEIATKALGHDETRFDVLLLHGQSCHVRGDLTTAALSLSRAMKAARDEGERARAAGVMAQVRLLAGDCEQASRYATDAEKLAADTATRLEGRNVVGKLLLAKEAWSEAEQHFAADACDAAAANLHSAELRAKLNRSIATLYLGRRETARSMLDKVLAGSERHRIPTATAFALSNLASLAILEHDYMLAISLSERAIEIRREIGSRLGMVQPITNLAELRLRLGMTDEAEDILRFGLHACGPNLPPSRQAYFSKTLASVHLERGHSDLARKAIGDAISGARGSSERVVLAQCHRIAARIALEDGDVLRAREELEIASQLKHTPHGAAELAVLQAMQLQAAGTSWESAARSALALAQQADDPDSICEARALLFQARVDDGSSDEATREWQAAVECRERIATTLPPAIKRRYLARRKMSAIDHLMPEASDKANQAPLLASETLPATQSKRSLVGQSPAMRALRQVISRIASTDSTVLITGETGTGKELVAEALHQASGRAAGPMVKVNCAALVETLLLSELFGHEKGAFTGASSRRQGRFEMAAGGTLFLDEIGDISPRTQVALLRVLQEGTFERVGGCTQLHANVRVVCATHRDLREMVKRGEFREDLYFRLCGMTVAVPPLRERLADLPELSQALLERANRTAGIPVRPLSAEAIAALSYHPWPGNVRELENSLRVAALFAQDDAISLDDFQQNVEALQDLAAPTAISSRRPSIPPPPASASRLAESLSGPPSSTDLVYAEIREGVCLADMKRQLEKDCIARALVESSGNITRAATLLGMKRPRLSQLVKQYNLASVLKEMKS